jgi:signal recognition particle receptor subunit beta
MFIHWALKEIHLKIVYYGTGLSGKTENLKYIYSHIDPALKGDIVMLKSREDRTIFFDFLQLEVGNIEGKKPKFNLYTVPGQIHYGLTRKVVLNGVDGIVFVADSRREMMNANLDTLLDLEKLLITNGKTLEDFPWVLQYNKRDLPDAESIDEMEKKLNFFGVPSFEAVATQGRGVFPTLKAVIKKVVGSVQAQLEGTQRMRA